MVLASHSQSDENVRVKENCQNGGLEDSGVTLDFYFGTGSKSSDLNEIFFMCYK
jgi:hypothetical protein